MHMGSADAWKDLGRISYSTDLDSTHSYVSLGKAVTTVLVKVVFHGLISKGALSPR